VNTSRDVAVRLAELLIRTDGKKTKNGMKSNGRSGSGIRFVIGKYLITCTSWVGKRQSYRAGERFLVEISGTRKPAYTFIVYNIRRISIIAMDVQDDQPANSFNFDPFYAFWNV
jgi:hypothetical protein